MAPSSCPCSKKKSPSTKVDHTYHDYSRYLNEGGVLTKHKKSHNNFPRRLHTLVSNSDYSGVITWMVRIYFGIYFQFAQKDMHIIYISNISYYNISAHYPHQPHGRAFKIIDRKRLVSEIIGTKYESFTRQLNGWGFKRLHRKGGGKAAVYIYTRIGIGIYILILIYSLNYIILQMKGLTITKPSYVAYRSSHVSSVVYRLQLVASLCHPQTKSQGSMRWILCPWLPHPLFRQSLLQIAPRFVLRFSLKSREARKEKAMLHDQS